MHRIHSQSIILFVSRHVPTTEQASLASEKGYQIIHVGDFDAFNGDFITFVNAARVKALAWDETGLAGMGQRDVVISVVHPALAVKALAAGFSVALFENGNRAPEGEKPSFFPKELHFFDPITM